MLCLMKRITVFNTRKSGHIACHCPNVCCFKCDEYSHIVVDCPHRIPPSGIPAHHHRSPSQHSHHKSSTSHHHPTDRHRSSRSRSQSHHQRYHSKIPIKPSEHILGHTTDTAGDITGVVHASSIPTLLHTFLTATPLTREPPLIDTHQPIHEITADHTLSQPIGQLGKPHIKIHPIAEDHMEIHTIRGMQESP